MKASPSVVVCFILAAAHAALVAGEPLKAPPQDVGLPYTRSARASALRSINEYVAVFASPTYGSRYAYVQGFKTRLDEADVLGGKALRREGVLYVPASFIGVLALPNVRPFPAPEYLRDKWVYALPRSEVNLPGTVRTLQVKGRRYVAFADAAKALGLDVYENPRGLALAARKRVDFQDSDASLIDRIVTLFDTPDELADPGIATAAVPTLRAQGRWTDHVSVKPEQLALLDGPQTEWAMTPHSLYSEEGFNRALLGSAVPAPGIYPRLLFSEKDVPMLRERMRTSKLGQRTLIQWEVLFRKTWWDPGTSDGAIFLKLADDKQFRDLQWPDVDASSGNGLTRTLFAGQKPGIRNSHVNYNTNSLVTMALYCLLTDNNERGPQVAAAICNYYRLIEPIIDEINARSDSEFGVGPDAANWAETAWRGMHGTVAHMDLAFALDFAGKWMSPSQKDTMRRIIAKATYGRRDNMQAAPGRVQDINHMTWHLTNFLAASAIEGLEGCDPEVLESGRRAAEAFCEWGIDKYGQIFESNGKNGGGIQFQILTMNVLARRGLNLWAHPHWRKLPEAQALCTSPDGKATLSSGTYGGTAFSRQALQIFHAFYPDNKAAEWLLTVSGEFDAEGFDPETYRAQLEKSIAGVRLPSPTNPGFVFAGIYDSDWDPISRASAGLPLTFNDDVHGILSAYSDSTPDAAWLCLHVRSNQYIGSGHHHADVGMFYFSGRGVNWITESPFDQAYDGKYHNLVLVDGLAQPDGLPARGDYIGATTADAAAFGSVNMTRSYSWKWMNQIIQWNTASNEPPAGGPTSWYPEPAKWELETDDPLPLAVYKGTQHNKSRPWWPTYVFSNWLPVLRSPFNPVRHAFRTAGLVRGKVPYGLVVDDIKKDDAERLYQWTAMTGVKLIAIPQADPGDLLLAREADVVEGRVREGSPLLLVRVFDDAGTVGARLETATDGPLDKKSGKPRSYDRIVAERRAREARFKTLLIPMAQGEPAPTTAWEPRTGRLTVTTSEAKDEFQFTPTPEGRTRFVMKRKEVPILESK